MKTTSELLPELRKRNPCATLERLAEMMAEQTGYKVSRENVRQMLDRRGLPTHRNNKIEYTCVHCGGTFKRYRREKPSAFCSWECKKAHNLVPLVCETCGEMFMRPQYVVLNWAKSPTVTPIATAEHIFCSRECHGRWLGSHYGGSRSKRDMV